MSDMVTNKPAKRIKGLRELAHEYDALLCDVWGVVHNGRKKYPQAVEALTKFKQTGKPTFLLTNAPRPNAQVYRQLDRLDVPIDDAFDGIISSGDVTRARLATLPQPLFHIGTDFDRSVFEGLQVELSDRGSANSVVCTGLRDDFNETIEDYTEELSEINARGLSFLCANPDIVVEHDGRMRLCAGALAKQYARMGGPVEIIGKPHAPIYQHALDRIEAFQQKPIKKKRILAIGDGLHTDIKGAIGFGLDVVYIAAGIHHEEYGSREEPNEEQLQQFLEKNGTAPTAWMTRLAW